MTRSWRAGRGNSYRNCTKSPPAGDSCPATLGVGLDPDELALVAIDAGADDFSVDDDVMSIYTKPEDLMAVRQALVDLGHEPDSAEIDRVPTTTVPLEASVAVQTLRMLEKLEDLDDVQKVYSNADFPEEVLAGYDG